MVVERLLRTGARLQVVPEGEKVYYEAFVKELDPVGVTISEPVSSEGKLEMSPGESWRFYLVGEDALYSFRARILERIQEGYRVERPQVLSRLQRREHYRLKCSLELEYWVIGGESSSTAVMGGTEKLLHAGSVKARQLLVKEKLLPPGKRAFTVNLSGGGLQMIVTEPLPSQAELLIQLYLEGRQEEGLEVKGKVIQAEPLQIGEQTRYRVGVSFFDLEEQTRERIIKYIFEEEAKRRGGRR